MAKIAQVTFREKSSWQKDDCLFCTNNATLEAVVFEKNMTALIRCCSDAQCKSLATEVALAGIKRVLGGK